MADATKTNLCSVQNQAVQNQCKADLSDSDLCTTSLITTSNVLRGVLHLDNDARVQPPFSSTAYGHQKRNPVATMHHSLATGESRRPLRPLPQPRWQHRLRRRLRSRLLRRLRRCRRRLPRLDRLRASTDNNSLPPDFLPSSRNPSLSPLFTLFLLSSFSLRTIGANTLI